MNNKLPTTNNRLLNYWERLSSTFWFLPGIMVIAAAILAFSLVALDGVLKIEEVNFLTWLLYTGGAEGTRGLLTAIAGSMVAVASTVFSITIAVLMLASSNYGPRLLRNFMRDTGNQVVLGTFVATFLYSLIVLRSVRANSDNTNEFVPHFATTFAILSAVASIGVLIYFIHHITVSLQASTIVAGVRSDLQGTIDRIFPTRIGHDVSEDKAHKGTNNIPENFDRESYPIKASGSGYIQTIDNKAILKITTEHDIIVQIHLRPGNYVVQGSALARVWPDDHISDELSKQINKAFTLGKQRTMTQDVEFGILELVEIALRALSPSLNDPFTAVMCINQLSTVLCELADHDFPSRYRYDDQHKLRVIADPPTFEQLTNVAFDQIRQNGKSSVMVLSQLLFALAVIAARVRNTGDCMVLRRQAILVERASHEGISEEADRQNVEEQFHRTIHAISEREEQLLIDHQADVSNRSSVAT